MNGVDEYDVVCSVLRGVGNIADLDRDLIQTQFGHKGAVLLRGFECDLRSFRAFTENLSKEIVTHLNFSRQARGDRTMTGPTPGSGHFFAHSEMAYVPFRPDVAWFYCVRPADEDGETTLYDGIKVLDILSQEVRRLFDSKRLLYENVFPESVWSQIFRDRLLVGSAFKSFDPDTFSYEFLQDNSLRLRFIKSAITQTRYGGRLAFCNSLLDSRIPKFEDESLIPKSVLHSVIVATEGVAVPIPWQSGDVLIVDNNRFMHGRRSFSDERRDIIVRFSNISF